MADGIEFLRVIKQAAMDVNEAGQPSDYVYGTVVSDAPLQINIEQKMTLGAEQLALCRSVTDYDIDITVSDWNTETADNHSHRITGKKKITVHNALKAGEKVVLIKQKGGQQYLVIDRVKK